MSLPPNASTAFWTASPICCSSRMSTTHGNAFPPAASTATCAHTHTQNVSSETKVARYLIDLSAPHPPVLRCRWSRGVWGGAQQFWQQSRCWHHLWQLSELWPSRFLDSLRWWRACSQLASCSRKKVNLYANTSLLPSVKIRQKKIKRT